MKQGKCTNIEGRCSKAISQEVIEYEVTADPECPECGRTLDVLQPPKPPIEIPWKTILIVVVSFLLIGGGIWWWKNRPKELPVQEIPATLPVANFNALQVKALQDSIRNALTYNRFKEADSLSRVLIKVAVDSNQPRESVIPFYNEVKEQADTHFKNIIVNDKDCNRVDIPFYYYVCAYILSTNDEQAHYVKERRKACEAFSKNNCKNTGFTISGGN